MSTGQGNSSVDLSGLFAKFQTNKIDWNGEV